MFCLIKIVNFVIQHVQIYNLKFTIHLQFIYKWIKVTIIIILYYLKTDPCMYAHTHKHVFDIHTDNNTTTQYNIRYEKKDRLIY